MSLAIGAANLPSFGNVFTPDVTPRGFENDATSYPVLRIRQNGTTPAANTINVFIDGLYSDFKYVGSIIEACGDKTTMAIQCTSGRSVASATCGSAAPTLTVTVGPSTYSVSTALSTSTLGKSAEVTAIENCVLGGTTAATCTITAAVSIDGTKTSTTSTTTMTGSAYHRYDVTVTGGADKTAAAATCSSSTKSAGTTLNTKSVVAWAMAGVAASMFAVM